MPEFFETWLKSLTICQLNEFDDFIYHKWGIGIGDWMEDNGYFWNEDAEKWEKK